MPAHNRNGWDTYSNGTQKKEDIFYKINAYSEILIFKVLLLNDQKNKTISL